MKALNLKKKVVGTRRLGTPDLYRVNFDLNNLKPFACLAFPVSEYRKKALKRHSFGDELVTSFLVPRVSGRNRQTRMPWAQFGHTDFRTLAMSCQPPL